MLAKKQGISIETTTEIRKFKEKIDVNIQFFQVN